MVACIKMTIAEVIEKTEIKGRQGARTHIAHSMALVYSLSVAKLNYPDCR